MGRGGGGHQWRRIPDLFVSNDIMPNFLWLNQRGDDFEEIGLTAGVGYSSEGLARSGMGVDAGDFDRDAREDLIVANIDSQSTSLYRNTSHESFDDINLKTGVGPATRNVERMGDCVFLTMTTMDGQT